MMMVLSLISLRVVSIDGMVPDAERLRGIVVVDEERDGEDENGLAIWYQ